jgi:hypothetical protein
MRETLFELTGNQAFRPRSQPAGAAAAAPVAPATSTRAR